MASGVSDDAEVHADEPAADRVGADRDVALGERHVRRLDAGDRALVLADQTARDDRLQFGMQSGPVFAGGTLPLAVTAPTALNRRSARPASSIRPARR